MSLQGPIILVEDDPNDIDIILTALKELAVPNKTICFTKAKEALSYLLITEDRPFIILCDIRMPEMNGLEFRKSIRVSDYLKKKSIPFVFYTKFVSQDIVNEAYDLDVQGFFEKPRNYSEFKDQLASIIYYWTNCLHPNRDIL